MSMQGWKHALAYIGVAGVAIAMAFMISLKFLSAGLAQEQQAPVEGVQPSPDSTVTVEAAPTQGDGVAELEGFLEPFIYDIVNRRDPFLPWGDFTTTDESPSRVLTPAQRFDLEQLKLVGIMWDVRDPKAMFIDPQSEVLILGRDESIGTRNGYIAAIREGEVVVVEATRKRGDVIYNTRVLRMER